MNSPTLKGFDNLDSAITFLFRDGVKKPLTDRESTALDRLLEHASLDHGDLAGIVSASMNAALAMSKLEPPEVDSIVSHVHRAVNCLSKAVRPADSTHSRNHIEQFTLEIMKNMREKGLNETVGSLLDVLREADEIIAKQARPADLESLSLE